MLGLMEDGLAVGGFHHVAAVHDVDALGVAGHKTQVMGDHDDRGVGLLGDGADHFQQLGLGGHVQGRGGLVGNEDVRVGGHGHGDHDALAHAAGELLGIVVVAGFRVGDVDHLHGLDGALAGLLGGEIRVEQYVLLDLVAHGQHGIQAGHGLLEDHGDATAANLTHGLAVRAEGQQVALHALQVHLAAGHPAGAGDQLQAAEHGHGLAGAGFAHDAHDLAAIHMQGDTLDGVEFLSVAAEGGHKILDVKQMSHMFCSFLRLRRADGDPGRRGCRRPGCSGR